MMTTETHNAYQLARLAGCGQPNGPESPGGEFLSLVASVYGDERYRLDDGMDELGDLLHELADGCVPIYTHQRWQVFVDLCAYDEDVTEYGDIDDLTDAAGVALYMIASRLLDALHDEAEEGTA